MKSDILAAIARRKGRPIPPPNPHSTTFILTLKSEEPSSDVEISVSSYATQPWTPRRLYLSEIVADSYEITSCSAGKLGELTYWKDSRGFDILRPRLHGTCEKITIEARRKRGAKAVKFLSGLIGTYEKQ